MNIEEGKMPAAPHIKQLMTSSSFIRKMFEEGIEMKARFGAENVYDFSLGNPDLEPPDEVLEAIRRLAASSEKGVHGYMPNAGFSFAREAMAKKVSAEQGVALTGENVVMSVGAAGALNSVFKAILSAGDEVLVPAPFFMEYVHYAANHGGKVIPVPSKADFAPDAEAMARAANERTAAVLINSPNNPTGKVYNIEDLCAVAAFLEEHKKKTGRTLLLIADEPYREIVYGGAKVEAIFPLWADSVVVSSFAKNLSLPGERIGYAAVNPRSADAAELVNAIIFATRILGYVNAPAFFQRVVAECWDAPADYSLYAKRRDALCSVMKNAGVEYVKPEGAFYLFCKAPKPQKGEHVNLAGDDVAFCNHLKQYHILAVPGSGFYGAGWLRLAYCVSPQTIEGARGAFAEAVAAW